MENKYYSKSNLVTAFLIGLFIGLGAYYLVDNSDVLKITKRNIDKKETGSLNIIETNTENGLNNNVVIDSGNKILVNDQPAGLKVDISSVTLPKGGWVVVHESIDGKPQNILGAQRFDAGLWDGTIDLLRNTEEGEMYYVMLHKDNGDKQFDYKNDTPILSGGNPITTTFYAIRIR